MVAGDTSKTMLRCIFYDLFHVFILTLVNTLFMIRRCTTKNFQFSTFKVMATCMLWLLTTKRAQTWILKAKVNRSEFVGVTTVKRWQYISFPRSRSHAMFFFFFFFWHIKFCFCLFDCLWACCRFLLSVSLCFLLFCFVVCLFLTRFHSKERYLQYKMSAIINKHKLTWQWSQKIRFVTKYLRQWRTNLTIKTNYSYHQCTKHIKEKKKKKQRKNKQRKREEREERDRRELCMSVAHELLSFSIYGRSKCVTVTQQWRQFN